MKCAVHPELDATGYCRRCGKPMCPACARPVREALYCEDCLAKITGLASSGEVAGTGGPAPAPQTSPRGSGNNPGIAFVLGFFPGLGAVYNGEYNKALIHILVFAEIGRAHV
jgi:hypothetical protein